MLRSVGLLSPTSGRWHRPEPMPADARGHDGAGRLRAGGTYPDQINASTVNFSGEVTLRCVKSLGTLSLAFRPGAGRLPPLRIPTAARITRVQTGVPRGEQAPDRRADGGEWM